VYEKEFYTVILRASGVIRYLFPRFAVTYPRYMKVVNIYLLFATQKRSSGYIQQLGIPLMEISQIAGTYVQIRSVPNEIISYRSKQTPNTLMVSSVPAHAIANP
jgi:hypothetical protein